MQIQKTHINYYKMYIIFQNVIENLDSKKLSVLKEILTDKAVKEKPSHSSVEDSGSQGKSKKASNNLTTERILFCQRSCA